ncbi:hypothetical protein FQZ97_827650 [compost metagenome]
MHALLNEHFFGGKNGGLCVQRIEDGFNQNNVGAAIDQAANLVGIGNAQIIECHRTIARIVDIRRQRRGAVCRSQSTCNKAAATIFLLRTESRAARKTRAVAVQLIDGIFHAVVGLRDGGRRKCIGFENISASHCIGKVNFFNRLWLGECQKIVVALQLAIAGTETLAAKMLFVKAQPLNLRTHGTVENQNALACGFGQCCKHFRTVRLCRR